MQQSSQPVKSFLWALGAITSFSLLAIAGREIGTALDTFEIMLYRSLVGMVIVLTFAMSLGRIGEITGNNLKLHVVRNIAHFIGQNLWFFALTSIPLSQLFAFEFSTPIWVAILAPVFLKEKLTALRALSASIGFIGILIVARPDMSTISPHMIAAILCAIGFASANIATKILTRSDSTTCILFWLVILQALFGLICAGYDGDIRLPDGDEIFWLVIIGMCGLAAHLCLTMAYLYSPAIIVAPMDFLRLPLIAIVAFFLYAEALEWPILLGAAVVFVGNIINIRSELKRKPDAIAP